MPLATTIAKCSFFFLLGLLLGIVVPILDMLSVAAINQWDDAPGGGFLIMAALLIGLVAGVSCGIFMAVSFRRYEIRKKQDGTQFVHAVSGAVALLSAISIAPCAFFLPLTGPAAPYRHRLSIRSGLALAAISICLFCVALRHLIMYANQFERRQLI